MEILFGWDVPMSLLLLPLVILLFYLYGTWTYNYWQSRGIPGPKPDPFFGNMWQTNKKGFQKLLCDWSQQYGRVYGIYINRQPVLVTNDLDILKEVMAKDFNHFTDRVNPGFLGKVIKKAVFFARGSDWRRIRNIMTPTFSSGKLRLMDHFINQCGETLAENLEKIARHDGKVSLKEYYGAFTLDVITGTAFGLQVNSQKDLNDPFLKNLKKIFANPSRNTILSMLITVFPFLAPLVGFLRRTFDKNDTSNFFLPNIKRIVEERKAEPADKRPTDFLQLLINAETTDDAVQTAAWGGKNLNIEEICAQIMIFFVAGYETTATTLQYLTYNLALNPEVQQKIVGEIRQQIGDERPTYENVGRLKYLDQAINETLRLFPPVSLVNREASETVNIRGVTIEKGSGVVIPIYEILRNPENFPKPEAFDPDRFSESNKGNINPLSFIPFGYGPRLCIGMRLALLELKIAMVHVLRKVKFVKTADLPEKLQFRPGGGLLIPVTPLVVQAELRLPEGVPAQD